MLLSFCGHFFKIADESACVKSDNIRLEIVCCVCVWTEVLDEASQRAVGAGSVLTQFQQLLLLFQLHGRSREQRYTRMADWDYIKTCAQAAAPMPLLGQFVIHSKFCNS